MKRLLDIFVSSLTLLIFLPIFLPVMVLVWLQDFHSPFYVAPRVGKGGKIFKMIKLRSMIKNADKSGVDSTSANDLRITGIGHFIRRYKMDELTQLWNVLKGDMSLVGPRPNVKRDTDLYTSAEMELLTVKPGITDLASIVFSDEGEILKDKPDPDISYNQLIRPWKSRLALLTVRHQSVFLDLKICFITAMAIVSKPRALEDVVKIVRQLSDDPTLVKIAGREIELVPTPPLGASEIVTSRDSQARILV